MRYRLGLIFVALALTGCSPDAEVGDQTQAAPSPFDSPDPIIGQSNPLLAFPVDQSPAPAVSILLEEIGCYGFCPSFTAKIWAMGQGIFEGGGYVAHDGSANFTVSPQEFAALESRLAPFRPSYSVAYDWGHCNGPVGTDAPSVKVTWESADGRAVTLDWYMGCREPFLIDNNDAVYDAWQEIPALAGLVGMVEDRQIYDD